MKNLITTIASVLILMVFMMQFTNNQIVHKKIMCLDREIWCAKEIIKQEGCLTDSRKNELVKRLSDLAKCSTDEIEISGTGELKERGEIIELHVKLPIDNLIAANEFFGITDEENKDVYEMDIYTTSEDLKRAD